MTMEKEPNNHEGEEEYSLERFQGDITDFAAGEVVGETKSGHFLTVASGERELNPDFDVTKLTEKDREIWRKIKNRTITLEEFREYSDAVGALDDGDAAKASRVIFLEFAANKAMRAIFEQSFKKKAL
jgi:hypothetical protein